MGRASEIRRKRDQGRRRGRFAYRLLVVLGMAVALGCEGGTRVNEPPDESYLRGIVRAYATATRNLGRPPKSMEEIKALYAPVDPDTAKYVTSPRDGQEFVVVWDLNLGSQSADTVLAYEREGAGGKRMVVTADSTVREVTEDEFKTLKFPKDYQPEI